MSSKIPAPGGSFSDHEPANGVSVFSTHLFITLTWLKVVGIVVGVAATAATLYFALDGSIDALDGRLDDLAERLASVEGVLRGLTAGGRTGD